MYYVYILVCLQTGCSYVGHSDDLIRCFRLHVAGSTKTTRDKLRQPVMVHWEAFPTRVLAIRRERYYKAGSGHRVKRSIIEENLKLFARLV